MNATKQFRTNGVCAGFSVIELVIAVLIMGIIAAVAMSRLLEGDIYNATVVRDQLVSLARAAQQRALGHGDVALIVRPNGNDLDITTAEDFVDINTYTTLQFSRIDARSVTLRGDVNVIDSCGATPGTDALSNAAPMVIQYDELGDLRRGGVTSGAGYPVTATSAMRLCINGEAATSLCFSPAGYAYAGDCQ